MLSPALQVIGRPIAVGALDRGCAVFRNLREKLLGNTGLRVVGVDQDCQLLVLHGSRAWIIETAPPCRRR